jgi:hypothetical protein
MRESGDRFVASYEQKEISDERPYHEITLSVVFFELSLIAK